MKTIKNPNIWKLGISLIPIPLLIIYVIAFRPYPIPIWIWIVGAISVIVYMGLVTYFCIKQKCYAQLTQNYLVLFVWAIIFLIQFYYLDILIGHLSE